MVIAAHIADNTNNNAPLFYTINFLATQHSHISFILFIDNNVYGLPKNITQHVVKFSESNTIKKQFWYNFQLPNLFKKYNVTHFITDAGLLAKKASSTKQYLFCNNAINPKTIFTHAHKIFVTEDFIKDEIVKKDSTAFQKIAVVYHAANQLNNGLQQIDTEQIKEAYSNGYDYILYEVTASSKQYLITLLKAFSQLKKWQKSSMKLVLLLQNIGDENIITDFKNYKYKADVVMVNNKVDTVTTLTAAAFTLIHLGKYHYNNIAFTALRYQVPIIVLDNITNKRLYGDAAIYTAANDTALAEKIQAIYKLDSVKKIAAQHGSLLLQKYNANAAANALFNNITT